jgi:RNA polymerase sigma-70 factor (ECF subfamily)
VKTELRDPPREPDADRTALVARLRAGEPEALAAVYGAYRARLYSFLLRLSGDGQRARDLTQDCFVRLALSAQRLAPDSDPGAWLFTVGRNLFVSQTRMARLRGARLAELSFFAKPGALPTPLEAVERDRTQAKLERALAALPIAQREVLLLVVVEGFDAAEVARMLDIEAVAVRKRLSRARAALKQALSGEGP